MRSFLSDHDQKVILDGKQSNAVSVSSGVPQGAVLGTILFLIYINDLPAQVRGSRTQLFANDCLMYREMLMPCKLTGMRFNAGEQSATWNSTHKNAKYSE